MGLTKPKIVIEESGGIELPTLSKPATASEILNTYQAISQAGTILTGTLVMPENTTIKTGTITDFTSPITIPDLIGCNNFVIFPWGTNIAGDYAEFSILIMRVDGGKVYYYGVNEEDAWLIQKEATFTESSGKIVFSAYPNFNNNNFSTLRYFAW